MVKAVTVGGHKFEVEPTNLRTPEPGKAAVGKHTGMRLFTFIRELFVSNESGSPNWHLTDEQLRSMIAEEFSDCEEVLRSLQGGKTKRNRIAVWRSLYNTGASFGHPACVSFQYDAQGRPVSGANRQPMTPEDQLAVCRHYEIPDPRFLSDVECAEIRSKYAKVRPALVQHMKKGNRSVDAIGRTNPRYVRKQKSG